MKRELNLEEVELIKNNEWVILSTANKENTPHCIIVMPSLVENNRIVISNIQMEETIRNVEENEKCFIDVEIKEKKAREFTPFYIKEYEKVVCGEDWYIAIKQDGTLEEMILQSNDNRTYDEVEQVKETLGLGNNINL